MGRLKIDIAEFYSGLMILNSQEELLRQIHAGEDSALELKSVRFKGDRVVGPSRDKLSNEIAAMANSNDGMIVLGVEDESHEITGIPRKYLNIVDRYIYEICNDSRSSH